MCIPSEVYRTILVRVNTLEVLDRVLNLLQQHHNLQDKPENGGHDFSEL